MVKMQRLLTLRLELHIVTMVQIRTPIIKCGLLQIFHAEDN
jgi:hypothetical protein